MKIKVTITHQNEKKTIDRIQTNKQTTDISPYNGKAQVLSPAVLKKENKLNSQSAQNTILIHSERNTITTLCCNSVDI